MSSKPGGSDRPAAPTAEGGDREEAFLQRWSRRKHEVARGHAPVAVPQEDALAAPREAPEKILTDADMPPVESLNENSDFSIFMSPGVSEALRGMALRKLFLLPGFNERCPLDSEWYDCRNLEPMGNIITHEMREQMEREAAKLKESLADLVDDTKDEAGTAEPAAARGTNPAVEPIPPVASDTHDAPPSADSEKPGAPEKTPS